MPNPIQSHSKGQGGQRGRPRLGTVHLPKENSVLPGAPSSRLSLVLAPAAAATHQPPGETGLHPCLASSLQTCRNRRKQLSREAPPNRLSPSASPGMADRPSSVSPGPKTLGLSGCGFPFLEMWCWVQLFLDTTMCPFHVRGWNTVSLPSAHFQPGEEANNTAKTCSRLSCLREVARQA